MKNKFFLVAFLLPLFTMANGPETLPELSKRVPPPCPAGVQCLGANERYTGNSWDNGDGSTTHECENGCKYCAYYLIATDEFVLGTGQAIQPVAGVGISDFAYSNTGAESSVRITGAHVVGDEIDPCEDPHYAFLCFE